MILLRALGLLVAGSLAGLLYLVGGSETSSAARANPTDRGQAVAQPDEASGSGWTGDSPRPALPDTPLEPADDPDQAELEKPLDEAELELHLDEDEVAAPDQMTLAEDEPAVPTPAPVADYVPTAADDEVLRQALGFLDDFVRAIEDHANDCERMASALEELFEENRELLAMGKTMDQAEPERIRWFQEQMIAPAQSKMAAITEPLGACMTNDRMMAVFENAAADL